MQTHLAVSSVVERRNLAPDAVGSNPTPPAKIKEQEAVFIGIR
jgi:hypothetical protein